MQEQLFGLQPTPRSQDVNTYGKVSHLVSQVDEDALGRNIGRPLGVNLRSQGLDTYNMSPQLQSQVNSTSSEEKHGPGDGKRSQFGGKAAGRSGNADDTRHQGLK